MDTYNASQIERLLVCIIAFGVCYIKNILGQYSSSCNIHGCHLGLACGSPKWQLKCKTKQQRLWRKGWQKIVLLYRQKLHKSFMKVWKLQLLKKDLSS